MKAKIRRPLTLSLVLAVAVGLATHTVRAGAMPPAVMTDMTADMPDMPMPQKCDGCIGDETGLMPSACSAFCGSVMVLPLVPALFDAVSLGTLVPLPETIGTGHTGPPDPYPPRPTRMS